MWEKFAYWNTDHNWDYRWWPVVVSMYDKKPKMLMVEVQFLRWRLGISIILLWISGDWD